MNQHELDRFCWSCAGNEVDLPRARLGIPAALQFRRKAQEPAPARLPLIEHPWVIVSMYVVVGLVLAFTAWRKA